MPDLGARITGQPLPPPYALASTRAAAALTEQLGRAGVSIDPTGTTMWLQDVGGSASGPIELTAAAYRRQGEVRALSWLHNSSNLNVCAVAAAGVSLGLEGNVRRDLAPQSGFYLPAGSGRVIASLRGDRHVESDPLNFLPALLAWDAPPGVASDAACAATINAETIARVLGAGGFYGDGAIGEQMRR